MSAPWRAPQHHVSTSFYKLSARISLEKWSPYLVYARPWTRKQSSLDRGQTGRIDLTFDFDLASLILGQLSWSPGLQRMCTGAMVHGDVYTSEHYVGLLHRFICV